MDKRNCEEIGHTYGVWKLDDEKGYAIRYCKECHFERVLPINESILEQIKKQKEASLFMQAFKKVDNKDVNVIGYLYTILDDYIHFLDENELDFLVHKMKELESEESIGLDNSLYINYLCSYLQNENIEAFEDTLNQFHSYNNLYFASLLTPNHSSGHHRS